MLNHLLKIIAIGSSSMYKGNFTLIIQNKKFVYIYPNKLQLNIVKSSRKCFSFFFFCTMEPKNLYARYKSVHVIKHEMKFEEIKQIMGYKNYQGNLLWRCLGMASEICFLLCILWSLVWFYLGYPRRRPSIIKQGEYTVIEESISYGNVSSIEAV